MDRNFPPSLPAGDLVKSLRSYFGSGWAFFLPYLALYLLYAGLKWPVNPSDGLGTGRTAPSLLHVYWGLHGLHLLLGMLSLRPPRNVGMPRGDCSAWWSASPWIFLGLIFFLPGLYLEWPSDPWEHFSRINQWDKLSTVLAHPAWKKSSYFFLYSFTSLAPTSFRLEWLGLIDAGCCVLLCWQYFRLGRAVGLGNGASFVFVLFQVFSLGNNLFGFFRYYGLSSAVFSQIGALALIRLALDTIPQKETTTRPRENQGSLNVFRFVAAGFLLLVFVTFNHVQGIGIAFLGILSVGLQRLLAWRRNTIRWLIFTFGAVNIAAFFWLPRNSELESIYKSQNWLTAWMGLNLIDPAAPPFSLATAVVTLPGWLNLALGFYLLRRNAVVGWLTIVPFVALLQPAFVIPYANIVAGDQAGYLGTFNRFLLGIPAGLALIFFVSRLGDWTKSSSDRPERRLAATILRTDTITAVTLLLLVTLPPGKPWYNRYWHAVSVFPDDLALKHLSGTTDPRLTELARRRMDLQAVPGVAYALQAQGMPTIAPNRLIHSPVIPYTVNLMDGLQAAPPPAGNVALVVPSATALYTPGSIAGPISGHWLGQEVALEHAAELELSAWAARFEWRDNFTRTSQQSRLFCPSDPASPAKATP